MRVLPIFMTNLSNYNNRGAKMYHTSQANNNVGDSLTIRNKKVAFGCRVTASENLFKHLEQAGCLDESLSEFRTSLQASFRENAGIESINDLLERCNLTLKLATDKDAFGHCLLVDVFKDSGKAALRKVLPITDGRVPVKVELADKDKRAPYNIERAIYNLIDSSDEKAKLAA